MTGHLTLPSLEIYPFSGSRDSNEGSGKPRGSCELDYQNVGETILVVSDVKSTTVNLDANRIESKSRAT